MIKTDVTKQFLKSLTILILLLISPVMTLSQENPSVNDYKYIRVGDLQTRVSAYGSERAWNNTYYEGLKWPAQYPYTDNFVIKRYWFAVKDFVDEDGEKWDTWANYIYTGYVDHSIFLQELKQEAKFKRPTIYVDGEDITAPYAGEVDEINPDLPADRVVTNVINTTAGLTIRRKVYAFTQQYHDDYFIKVSTFKNTGNVDDDAEIELSGSLKGLRVGWGTRYSVSREGAMTADNQQSWGKFSWVTRRGEDYKSHIQDVHNFTESTPLEDLDWIRCGFSWMGQSEANEYDNIGAPDLTGSGRLTAPQFAGSAVLHVDKSSTDKSDDPDQPVFLGWHAGDTYPSIGNLKKSDMDGMAQVYKMLEGTPAEGEKNGGQNRLFEDKVNSITDQVVPYKIHNDGGGTNVMLTYGPWDLAHGDSVVIVEAEGVNGLSRRQCEIIGKNWLDETGDYQLPPSGQFEKLGVDYGSTTDDRDVYKNAWVYTGADSIMMTFRRALSNYDMDFNIPQPPKPPSIFEVTSGGDKIMLSWALSESEDESNFGGYRLYRAVGKPDTTFEQIAELPPGTDYFEDKSAIRGFAYYYYISAVSDGSQNSDGIANPTGSLESGKFYTMTNKAAYLKRMYGENFGNIRIVPNPFNIRTHKHNFPDEKEKIMFYEIPPYCDIKIYTERGDLIKVLKHRDGSGDEAWNLLTSSRQEIVSGVYIAYIEVTQDFSRPDSDDLIYKKGDSTYKKFIIIR